MSLQEQLQRQVEVKEGPDFFLYQFSHSHAYPPSQLGGNEVTESQGMETGIMSHAFLWGNG